MQLLELKLRNGTGRGWVFTIRFGPCWYWHGAPVHFGVRADKHDVVPTDHPEEKWVTKEYHFIFGFLIFDFMALSRAQGD